MSTPVSPAEAPYTAAPELMGPNQLEMLRVLGHYDEADPFGDARTAVAAQYVLEQQTVLGYNAGSTFDAYQQALRTQSEEARLESLLEERIRQRAVPPADEDDFNGLMANYAAAGAEQELRSQHRAALERRTTQAVVRVSVSLSDEQVAWEVAHGTTDTVRHRDLDTMERMGYKIVDSGFRTARKAFNKRDMQPLTPAELVEAAGYPEDGAGVIVSELIKSRALTRDAAANTVTMDPQFRPVRFRDLVRTVLGR